MPFPMSNLNDVPQDRQPRRFELPTTPEEHERMISHIKALNDVPADPTERAFYGDVLWNDITLRFKQDLTSAAQSLFDSLMNDTCLPHPSTPKGILLESFDRFLCSAAVVFGFQLDWSIHVSRVKMRWEQTGNLEMLEAYTAATLKHARILAGLDHLEVDGKDIVAARKALLPELEKLLIRWRDQGLQGYPSNEDFASFVQSCVTDSKAFPRLCRERTLLDWFIRRQDSDFAARLLGRKRDKHLGQLVGLDAEGFLMLFIGKSVNLKRRALEIRVAKTLHAAKASG